MITKFRIKNFKSLVDFDLPPSEHEMGSFTCLIGLNGAGKSTLLQAFDFIAHIAAGGVDDWLERREWKKGQLVSHLGKRTPVISFVVGMRTVNGARVEWEARFNSSQLKCTYESITSNGEVLLKLDEGRLTVANSDRVIDSRFDKAQVPFQFLGSVISVLKLQDAHPDIGEIKSALQGLKSFELLNPQAMRRRAKSAEDIGTGGEKLSAFLGTFSIQQRQALITQLQSFYPKLRDLSVNTMRFGWKNLRVTEDYTGLLRIDATHLNDGLLRVIAILAQAQSNHQFLLFDEIENGINPVLVGKLMDFLVHLGNQNKQVIVTTHSPVILNYLTDDVARNGVILLYKTEDGKTRSCRYFDQPETGYKLEALGPGEVFVDTDLAKLVSRLAGDVMTNDREPSGVR